MSLEVREPLRWLAFGRDELTVVQVIPGRTLICGLWQMRQFAALQSTVFFCGPYCVVKLLACWLDVAYSLISHPHPPFKHV